jgi:hypothetical protein
MTGNPTIMEFLKNFGTGYRTTTVDEKIEAKVVEVNKEVAEITAVK